MTSSRNPWDSREATTTTSPPSGGAPITLTSNYTNAAGQTLTFDQGAGFLLAAVVTVSNSGTISVSNNSAGYGAYGFEDTSENASPDTIDNTATGVIDVVANTGNAYGYSSGADAVDLNNSGQIEVTADNGNAYGLWDYGGYGPSEVDNSAGGVISVMASQTGIGLWGYQFGNSVTNLGTIKVTAGTAYGVVGANGLNNSGSIIATGTLAGGGSIAVDISAPATFYGGTGLFSNSGLIQATTAFFFDTSGYSPAYSGNITVKNTGRVIGARNRLAWRGSDKRMRQGLGSMSTTSPANTSDPSTPEMGITKRLVRASSASTCMVTAGSVLPASTTGPVTGSVRMGTSLAWVTSIWLLAAPVSRMNRPLTPAAMAGTTKTPFSIRQATSPAKARPGKYPRTRPARTANRRMRISALCNRSQRSQAASVRR